MKQLRISICLLFMFLAGSVLTGCKTTEDSANDTSRPWNAPRQWESGLPGFQNERR